MNTLTELRQLLAEALLEKEKYGTTAAIEAFIDTMRDALPALLEVAEAADSGNQFALHKALAKLQEPKP